MQSHFSPVFPFKKYHTSLFTPIEVTLCSLSIALIVLPNEPWSLTNWGCSIATSHLPAAGIECVLNLFNSSQIHYLPHLWKFSIVIMLCKPGKPPVFPESCHTICLLQIISKCLSGSSLPVFHHCWLCSSTVTSCCSVQRTQSPLISSVYLDNSLMLSIRTSLQKLPYWMQS